MKILSIGNSFSVDAQRYLHQIAKENGDDIFCGNTYIGGCSLERHYNNIIEDKADYEYHENGEFQGEMISIKDALLKDEWDYVTVQQVSSFSGYTDSYYPYITEIIKYVKELRPNAKIIMHQTWSYENGSFHGDFFRYDNDSDKMHNELVKSYSEVAKRENIDIIFPCGEIIKELRGKKLFDYQNGGASLCRDTFHMDFVFGRYALSLTWYKVLTGKDVTKTTYLPPVEDDSSDNIEKINLIRETVENYLK